MTQVVRDPVEGETEPLLEELETAHPGLGLFLAWVGSHFGLRHSEVRRGFGRGLELLGKPRASAACRAWEELAILPGLRVATDHQVRAMWQSPLFSVLLESVLEFYPPDDADVPRELPPPCADLEEFASRELPPLRPYWRHSLHLVLPELFLEPFLPAGAPLTGCDLACGWGRASLSLRRHRGRRLVGCDLSSAGLERFAALAESAGLRRSTSLVRTSVMRLPFADSTFDFFFGLDIFEHLTDAGLEAALAEVLRVARPGAVLYAEVPANAYCPALTHLQHFSGSEVVEVFEGLSFRDRRLRLLRRDSRAPHCYSFRVVERRRLGKPGGVPRSAVQFAPEPVH